MATPSQFATASLLPSRMAELCDPASPWHRSLWGVGTITSLKEVIEAVPATWDHILTNDGAMSDFKRNAISAVKADFGLGDAALRKQITDAVQILKPDPSNEGRTALAKLEAAVRRADFNYLATWADAIEAGQVDDTQFEATARSITTHLIDSGLHERHVLGWLLERQKTLTTTELIREAIALKGTKSRDFTFYVGFTELPRRARDAMSNGTLIETSAYVDAYNNATNSRRMGPPERLVGAAKVTVKSVDPYSAMAQLNDWIQRLQSRSALGLGSEGVRISAKVVDVNAPKIWDHTTSDLLVIPTLLNPKLVKTLDQSPLANQVDDALMLLAPHLQATSGISAATLWAACEGLLGRIDSNGHSVADRLADIVACSFPRHEAFALIWRARKERTPELAEAISDGSTFEQMLRVMEELAKGVTPSFTLGADIAAANRLRLMQMSSVESMKRVRNYIKAAFRRLYYQRNFIMHAAKFDSVSLPMTTRVSPKLVAAGIDQIVSASNGRHTVSPLDLAARAALELEVIGKPGAKHLASLLS